MEAVELSLEALQIAEDAELRREVSSWLESLGDPAGAARVLRPIVSSPDAEPSEVAGALLRTGILKSRAGDLVGAGVAFEGALALDALDAASDELAIRLSRSTETDPDPLRRFEEAASVGTSGALSDVIAFWIARPRPVADVLDLFVRGLLDLVRLDVDRALILARRSLDVFGPRNERLRDAMLSVAAHASAQDFWCSIVERALASRCEGMVRSEQWLRLAVARELMGDFEGQARAVAKAADEGCRAPNMRQHVLRLAERDLSPDGRIWWLRAQVSTLGQSAGSDSSIRAWRELAISLWDMADDRAGALDAWRRVGIASVEGGAALLFDMVTICGADFAFEQVGRWLDDEEDASSRGILATGAALAAFSMKRLNQSFELASRALAALPRCTRALEIAEAAESGIGRRTELSALYDTVAGSAYGRFARRAAHYRGARHFERSSDHTLALWHAIRAFHAVPSRGHGVALLARMAERAGERSQAIRAIELQAEREGRGADIADWLIRAAGIAGDDAEGRRTRVDLLLRAVVAAPSRATIVLLRNEAEALVKLGPGDCAGLGVRLAEAAGELGERCHGPTGARIALDLVSLTLALSDDSDAAIGWLERAVACDADVEEYSELVGSANRLSQSDRARALVEAVVEDSTSRTDFGIGLLVLMEAVARGLGDEPLAVRVADARARRDPAGAPLLFGEQHPSPPIPTIAPPTSAPASDRAARWEDIAVRREQRGDYAGALQAQREACAVDGSSAQRWRVLERLSEQVGDEIARVQGLEGIALCCDGEERLAALKRLARLHEGRADMDAARSAWQRILEIDPSDADAELAQEAALASAGRYVELVEHLADRADRLKGKPGGLDDLPALRLRRVAILEQRLGDVDRACAELEILLDECPEHIGALRYLADLLDRTEQYARSASLWHKAASQETSPHERLELEVRAGKSSLASGDATDALECARHILELDPSHQEALTLRVEALRPLHRDAELGDALESLARSGVDPRARVDALLEAAVAASRARDPVRAIERARRAVALAGDRATPPLLAQALEYRLRGPGDTQQATRTIAELSRMGEPLGRDDEALRSFLLAEAIDVVEGNDSGMRELDATRAVIGDHPLLAVGVAERLSKRGELAEALREYRTALSGSLLDLRRPGDVATAAAEIAGRAGRHAEQSRFLEMATTYAQLRSRVDSFEDAGGARLTPDMASEAVPQLRPARAAKLAFPAFGNAPNDAWVSRARQQDPPADDDSARPAGRAGESSRVTAPSPAKGSGPSTMPAPNAEVAALETTLQNAKIPSEKAAAQLALGRARLDRGDIAGAEALFWDALGGGCEDAVEVLDSLLRSSGDRTCDRVRMRWQHADLKPYDVDRLDALQTVAAEDGDTVYARAVEHVMRSLDPGSPPLVPPPLGVQPEHPGLFSLLARPSSDALGESFSLLWEGAMQIFVREAVSYSITGIERVVPGPASLLARLIEVALRILDSPRIPVFATRTNPGKPVVQAALLSPPSVILSGSVQDDTPALRYALGTGLSAALPQNILRLGLPPSECRIVLDALFAAFGPTEVGRTVDPRSARLAESFWQIVPARVQRRLQELLSTVSHPVFDDVVESAAHSGRRVGMFLAGDFQFVSGTLLDELPGRSARRRLTNDTAAEACADSPALMDIMRLAISPEYAHARWNSESSIPQRSLRPSARFSLV